MTQFTAAAIIVAAGRGERAGGSQPKQYRDLGGQSILARAIEALASHPDVGRVQSVIGAGDHEAYGACVASLSEAAKDKLRSPVLGGAARQASVLAGLEALAGEVAAPIVLIHDGARPFVDGALIGRAIAAAQAHGAAVPVRALVETLKRVDAAGDLTDETLALEGAVAVQTPQAFDFAALLAAHRGAARAGRLAFTDDASVMQWAGARVATFPGAADNMKITQFEDFARAEALLAARLGDVRVGQGYDVHAFGPGDHVWLGGVRIPHARSLIGHSDADVVLHALTDAIMGALGDGDIGSHFPPSDSRWKGASSDRFLARAAALAAQRGGMIAHLDATIVCEAPKIGPHREAMRQAIAAIAGLKLDRVGVKATTSERLGFTGREEGIAALATATVRLPFAAQARI